MNLELEFKRLLNIQVIGEELVFSRLGFFLIANSVWNLMVKEVKVCLESHYYYESFANYYMIQVSMFITRWQ